MSASFLDLIREDMAVRAPLGGSWKASFRFCARIGTMNQVGTPLPALSPQGGERVAEGRERGGSWSLHDFRITHRTMKPATDRSADSLVRECLGLDSCGHGCPRSDSRFMGRGHLQNSDVNRG